MRRLSSISLTASRPKLPCLSSWSRSIWPDAPTRCGRRCSTAVFIAAIAAKFYRHDARGTRSTPGTSRPTARGTHRGCLCVVRVRLPGTRRAGVPMVPADGAEAGIVIGAWFGPIGIPHDYCFDCAEIRRMNRPDDDRRALFVRLARQRVRFILSRLVAPRR